MHEEDTARDALRQRAYAAREHARRLRLQSRATRADIARGRLVIRYAPGLAGELAEDELSGLPGEGRSPTLSVYRLQAGP